MGQVQGRLVVFEGIYGSGRLIVELVEQLRRALVEQGRVVYEIDSPDSGRAQLMGAAELDGSWRYGRFEPDFFFELAGRSRVASVARDHLARGEVVLCKCFTLSSMAHAALQRHDWVREGLGALEARARGLPGRELLADLTIFIDVAPETAAAELGPSRSPHFSKVDLETQRQVYLEQLAGPSVGPVKVIAGSRSAEALFPEALAAIRALG